MLLTSDSPDGLQTFVASIFETSFESRKDDVEATKAWCEWLSIYAERIERDLQGGEWQQSEGSESDAWEKREREMRHANPRFVLRQWVLEEIIKRVQDDTVTGKRALAKVHEVGRLKNLGSWQIFIAHCYRWLPILIKNGVLKMMSVRRAN